MPTHQVNLDALIRREDFEAGSEGAKQKRVGTEIKLVDLERSYFSLLRKPDFQRETCSWSPERVCDLVRSFVDGDLIPSIILWWSSQNGTLFVIDGAHRVSALLSWIHDDYGDGKYSTEFWGTSISQEQKRLAHATKHLIQGEIGAYAALKYVVEHPDESPNEITLRRARNAATFKIDSQWVEGTAATAEESFFRINGSATVIDPTELGIIKARRKPNAIATRALMNAGSGHRYWSSFSAEKREDIEKISRSVYEALFKPILESPIKTLDLPVGGQGYSANAFKMLFDLVNQVNSVTNAMWQEPRGKRQKQSWKPTLPDDADGKLTLQYLKHVKSAASLISGADYAGSLGLHPVVYFYAENGRFQPTAFLATVKFFNELKKHDSLHKFTKCRRDFEEFLVKHREFVSAIGHRFGSRTRPVDAIVAMYTVVFDALSSGESSDVKIRRALLNHPMLHQLKAETAKAKAKAKVRRRHFKSDDKSTAFIRRAIDTPIRCAECGARLHVKSITHDHEQRIEDGGVGSADNAQPMHPFCNSGVKERRVSQRKKLAKKK